MKILFSFRLRVAWAIVGAVAMLVALNGEVECNSGRVWPTAAVALAFQLADTCRPLVVVSVMITVSLVAAAHRWLPV